MHCLARAAEFRDDDTGFHVKRVGLYAGVIARQMGLDAQYVETIELAAQLHDVGKTAIPDVILNKPGRLEPDEHERIKSHCAIARQIIQPLDPEDWRILRRHANMGMQLLNVRSSALITMAAVIAQTHHERWDGTGSPASKSEDEKPSSTASAMGPVFSRHRLATSRLVILRN